MYFSMIFLPDPRNIQIQSLKHMVSSLHILFWIEVKHIEILDSPAEPCFLFSLSSS